MHPQYNYHRLITHGLFCVQHQVQVALVGGIACLAPIAPVGKVLPGVATRDAVFPGSISLIGPVLQRDGHIAVAARVPVGLGVAIGKGALDEHQGKVGLIRAVHPVVILLNKLRPHRVHIPRGHIPPEEGLHGPDMPCRYIDLGPIPLGQRAGIFHHDHGPKLSLVPRLAELLTAGGLGALLRVQIRVLKEPAAEDIL